jgi:hypothetical protein
MAELEGIAKQCDYRDDSFFDNRDGCFRDGL